MVHDHPDVVSGPQSLGSIAVVFDEERLVSDAGLLLTASLAERLGVEQLVNDSVWLGHGVAGAALPGRKVMTLVHGMLAGADCIDDMNVLREPGRVCRRHYSEGSVPRWRRWPMSRPKKFPDELVRRGVRLAVESGRPVAQVARDLGMSPETLRRAVRQAEADGGLRPDLASTAEREEIKQLRREVFELRRANEILKTASAFFARELDTDRTR